MLNKGFTLVEMLVSLSIFSIITSLAVYNHAQFNGSVLLTDLAYEIALSIRQAQFYGISVRQNSSQLYNSGYGVHFDLRTAAGQISYKLFEDKSSGNLHVWDSNEDLQNFSISRGNKISRICVVDPISGTDCSQTIVDISFIRPNPDAFITVGGSNGSYKNKAQICISSPDASSKRKITVESTGQISVGTDDPPTQICN